MEESDRESSSARSEKLLGSLYGFGSPIESCLHTDAGGTVRYRFERGGEHNRVNDLPCNRK